MSYVLLFLTILEVIAALLIIGVILMQRSKSGGGLGAIGGGMTEEVFGAGAGNFLTRTTVILSLFFLINTLFIVYLQGSITRSKNVSIIDSIDKEGVNLIKSPTESDEETDTNLSLSSEDQSGDAISRLKESNESNTEASETEPQPPAPAKDDDTKIDTEVNKDPLNKNSENDSIPNESSQSNGSPDNATDKKEAED